jgi:hypothetical protein
MHTTNKATELRLEMVEFSIKINPEHFQMLNPLTSLTKLDSSDARKRAAVAISLGLPIRPIGIIDAKPSFICSDDPVEHWCIYRARPDDIDPDLSFEFSSPSSGKRTNCCFAGATLFSNFFDMGKGFSFPLSRRSFTIQNSPVVST